MQCVVFPGEFPYYFEKKSSENSLKQFCTALWLSTVEVCLSASWTLLASSIYRWDSYI